MTLREKDDQVTVTGTVVVHTRGFGFVDIDGAAPAASAFIAPPYLNALLAGDRVRARIKPSGEARWSVTEVSLLDRRQRSLFGTAVVTGGRAALRVDPMVSNRPWPLVGNGVSALADGAPIVARIRGDQAEFERAVAEPDVSLERVLVRYELRTDFGEALETLARNATDRFADARRDLRDVPTVTIDAPSSRDLDDALSALPADDSGALRVLVSIADVGALVEEGNALDLEARRRGTSVYLAGRVIPMLPRSLSEDQLSLLPNTDRPAITAELRIDPDGRITATDLYRSRIRSHARLSYQGVAAFLDRGDRSEIPGSVLETVRRLRAAAARLSVTRLARGGVELLREEAYVTLDADSREPVDVDARVDTSANKLVERLMVAANEAVARWCRDRGIPAALRAHDAPATDAVHSIERAARNFGFELALGDSLSPVGLAAVEAQFSATELAPAMYTVLMRALGPARYTTEASPHFGLAAPLYCHFTSPIRRYADVIVHRQIAAYLDGRRDFGSGANVQAWCDALNELARRARKAETERLRMTAARWFGGRIGERFTGNVVAVKPFGLIVQLAGTGVSGSVQADNLPGENLTLDSSRLSLVGTDGTRYTVGESLEVEVASANEELGRIDLLPLRRLSD